MIINQKRLLHQRTKIVNVDCIACVKRGIFYLPPVAKVIFTHYNDIIQNAQPENAISASVDSTHPASRHSESVGHTDHTQ